MAETTNSEEQAARLREAEALHLLEGNPLTDAEMAMFAMFDREGWSHAKRRAFILGLARTPGSVPAE